MCFRGVRSTFWYPAAFAARIPFHASYSINAQATGLTYGLVAGQQASIARDTANVPLVVSFKEAPAAWARAVTEWADIILEGEIGAPFPAMPTAPVAATFGLGSETAIRARTIPYAGVVKAVPDYTAQVSDNYGIVAGGDAAPGTPEINASAMSQSQIRLDIFKADYSSVAVDSRRGGGIWEQIVVCETSEIIDGRGLLVAWQPEVREHRCQGRENNVRAGALSAVVSAVTVQ